MLKITDEKRAYLRTIGYTEAMIDELEEDVLKEIDLGKLVYKTGSPGGPVDGYDRLFGSEKEIEGPTSLEGVRQNQRLLLALENVRAFGKELEKLALTGDGLSLSSIVLKLDELKTAILALEGDVTGDDRKEFGLDWLTGRKEIRQMTMAEVAGSAGTCSVLSLIEAFAYDVQSIADFTGEIKKADVRKLVRDLVRFIEKI